MARAGIAGHHEVKLKGGEFAVEAFEMFKYIPTEELESLLLRAKRALKIESRMLKERAQIEAAYAKALDAWTVDFKKKVGDMGHFDLPEVQEAVTMLLKEGKTTADLHRGIAEKIASNTDPASPTNMLTNYKKLFFHRDLVNDTVYTKGRTLHEFSRLLERYRDAISAERQLLTTAEKKLSKDVPDEHDLDVDEKNLQMAIGTKKISRFRKDKVEDGVSLKVIRNRLRYMIYMNMRTINTVIENVTSWEKKRITISADAFKSSFEAISNLGVQVAPICGSGAYGLMQITPETLVRDWVESRMESIGIQITEATFRKLLLTPEDVTLALDQFPFAITKKLTSAGASREEAGAELETTPQCSRVYDLLLSRVSSYAAGSATSRTQPSPRASATPEPHTDAAVGSTLYRGPSMVARSGDLRDTSKRGLEERRASGLRKQQSRGSTRRLNSQDKVKHERSGNEVTGRREDSNDNIEEQAEVGEKKEEDATLDGGKDSGSTLERLGQQRRKSSGHIRDAGIERTERSWEEIAESAETLPAGEGSDLLSRIRAHNIGAGLVGTVDMRKSPDQITGSRTFTPVVMSNTAVERQSSQSDSELRGKRSSREWSDAGVPMGSQEASATDPRASPSLDSASLQFAYLDRSVVATSSVGEVPQEPATTDDAANEGESNPDDETCSYTSDLTCLDPTDFNQTATQAPPSNLDQPSLSESLAATYNRQAAQEPTVTTGGSAVSAEKRDKKHKKGPGDKLKKLKGKKSKNKTTNKDGEDKSEAAEKLEATEAAEGRAEGDQASAEPAKPQELPANHPLFSYAGRTNMFVFALTDYHRVRRPDELIFSRGQKIKMRFCDPQQGEGWGYLKEGGMFSSKQQGRFPLRYVDPKPPTSDEESWV